MTEVLSLLAGSGYRTRLISPLHNLNPGVIHRDSFLNLIFTKQKSQTPFMVIIPGVWDLEFGPCLPLL